MPDPKNVDRDPVINAPVEDDQDLKEDNPGIDDIDDDAGDDDDMEDFPE